MKLLSALFLFAVLFTTHVEPVEARLISQICDFFYSPVPKNPFKHAFPEDVVQGELLDRAKTFEQLYPEHVKIVDDVSLEIETSSGMFKQSKKVMVISIPENVEQQAQFLKDYHKHFSHNAVSFSGAGHLYTKVGTKTLDHLNGVNEKDYYLSTSDHFETLVQLSDEEFHNLKLYAQYSTKKYKKTIGGFLYDGAMQSKGRLNDNCGVGANHNCTSWMTLAPIGNNGESIKELVGASAWDVHRNPGWWQSFLAGKTGNDRVPFVVYFSTSPLATSLEKVKSGSSLPLGYNLH